MTSSEDVGARLLVAQIDKLAADTSRIWASIPVDDESLSKGFQDVTYTAFANAINRAAIWLHNKLPAAVQQFETVAYCGPKDIRYPILAVAVAKVGRKLLLPSLFASLEAQAHLVQASACRVFIHDKSYADMVDHVLSKTTNKSVSSLEAPILSDLLHEGSPPPFVYGKSWEQAKDDPWLIFHTSGTTGFPKLITYTHKMMSSLDASELMPDAHEETMNRHFQNRRWYTPLPSLHFVGMTVALQFPVFLGSVAVIGPPSAGPTKPSVAEEVIRRGKVQGVMLPPALIDGLCQSDSGLECLRRLDCVYFAGAPLSRRTADKLLGHVPVKPAMGSTEAGAYFLRITGEDDWEYYSFRTGMGIELQHRADGLYEAVFVRSPDLQRWQQVFQVYPDLQTFPTNDLFTQHPSKPGSWKYVGRMDDMIPFSHGENLYVTDIESEITAASSDILAVLIGGQGRPKPYLLVEWKEDGSDEGTRYEQLQPVLDDINKRLSDLAKLSMKLTLFTRPSKPLVRTIKGSISRRETEKLYQAEIEQLFTMNKD